MTYIALTWPAVFQAPGRPYNSPKITHYAFREKLKYKEI